ncbi:hypothetical protein BFC22_11665 [Carnobacterium divergens]|uniref:hypothetical protein n=1 Tax=Carnobacterium divergens TaxID=2748 RepID=UPI000E710FF3|nr:hypothetical protein [Carnobacterium divergens]AOA00702.1 hypothetical protein BFC22_11665 [Carnobacterium divergens]
MKKILRIVIITCLSLVVITGCSGKENTSSTEDGIKDGTYYRYGGNIKVELTIQGDEVLRSVNSNIEKDEVGKIDKKTKKIKWDSGDTNSYTINGEDTVEIESSTTGEMLMYYKEGSVKQKTANSDWENEQ